jgi:DNA-binding winged helix-turn-helix (wHTH) protein/tetratricopeptide (TPR) repeat protein
VLFEFGDFVLDESSYELRQRGASVPVDKKVFALLAYMVRRPGKLVTRAELIEHVWDGRTLSETVLSGAISRVRKVLGKDEKLVVNVHGVGYRFNGSVKRPGTPVTQDASFVGRAGALESVRSALDQARAERGSIVVVVGEPGIGKTQLAEVSAAIAAEDGVATAWGHCPSLAPCPPFWPIIQLLRGALRESQGDEIRRAIESALAMLTHEGDATPGGPSAYRRFDSVMTALRAFSNDRRWLLVLDDLQWADSASLRLLAYLAPEITHLGLVILATARNTEPSSDDTRLEHVLGHRNTNRIELGRLTLDDVAEYVACRLGEQKSALSRAVFAKSEGNPFFMRELLRPFSGAGGPHPDELDLSGPALDIVRQRVRALGDATLALLSAAAVVGRDFDLGLLAHVTGLEAPTLRDELERARQASVVLLRSEGAGYYTFGHDLIRSVLLEALPPSEEARLHLRTAEAIRRRYPVGEGPLRTDLAHHLLAALPNGDLFAAIDYTRRCALAVADSCAHADAAALLRRALSALELASDPDPRLRCELLLLLSRCERAFADPRFPEHLVEAANIGREHGFGEVLAEAGRHMSFAPGFTSLEGAREVLEAADRILPSERRALRSGALSHLSWTVPYCFDAERAAALIEKAEALARESGDTDALAVALQARLYFTNGPDSPALAAAISAQVDVLYERSPPLVRVHWTAQAEFSRIVTSLQNGDLDATERAISAFGDAARRLDHAELEWHHQRACVVHRMNRGEFHGVKEALQDLQDRATQLQLFSLGAVRALDRGVLLRETEGPAALTRYDGEILIRESDCPYRLARKIRSLVEVGAHDRARAALEALPAESLGRLPHDRDYLSTLTHLAIASVALRSLSHAEMLYTLLSPYPHLHGADLSFHCDGSISHHLGTLARALGRKERAVAHLENALDSNQRAGFAANAAHSAYELATLLIDVVQTEDAKRRARTVLANVCEWSERMGMVPLALGARDLLRGV